MEYHEIGERFEYDGVVLEVVEVPGCECCFFNDYGECKLELEDESKRCGIYSRFDNKSISYKLVEQCKPKENDNMKKQIYYADLTPCDNMQDYKVAVFVPQFVADDTKEFDTEHPIWVVQLATTCGWCIVAKWRNNGSTRIYGGTADAIKAGVSILGGCCDSGDCGYAFGEEKIYSKFISEEDISVFDGYTEGNIIEGMKREEENEVRGIDKTFATQVTNIQSDEEIYGSLLDKLFTTYKAKDADYGSAFAEMFDELGIDYAYGKLREKINRIKVLRKQPNMVENEGLEDALLDTAGYAILTLVELKKKKRIMLQITLINCFSPYYPKDADDSKQIKDDRFDKTIELIRCGVIKELHAYPQAHIDRFRQEFIDDILVDGYPDKEKMNVELVSKSGIHYFVVDGRCFPTESIKEELKRESNDKSE